MEWRCEWCGKPHAENDPPCDECGHGRFERAVAPVAPEGEGGPTVWVCTDCGRVHPRHNPPCSRCGAMTLEQREQSADDVEPLDPDPNGEADDGGLWSGLFGGDDEEDDAPSTMTVWACEDCGRAHPTNNPPCNRCGGMTFERRERDFDADAHVDPASMEDADDLWAGEDPGGGDGAGSETAPAGDSTTVWACTECGRTHARNNPPCSRCGAMTLERREERFEDVGPSSTGWLGALDLQLVLGFLGATVLLALIVGSALGYITLPGQGPPTVPAGEVPGAADSAAGLDLGTVETEYVAALNDRRESAGAAPLDPDEALDARATYYNRRLVQAEHGDADPPSAAEMDDAFGVSGCEARPNPATVTLDDAGSFDSAAALGEALAAADVEQNGMAAAGEGRVGVDVHVAPGGTVYLTRYAC